MSTPSHYEMVFVGNNVVYPFVPLIQPSGWVPPSIRYVNMALTELSNIGGYSAVVLVQSDGTRQFVVPPGDPAAGTTGILTGVIAFEVINLKLQPAPAGPLSVGTARNDPLYAGGAFHNNNAAQKWQVQCDVTATVDGIAATSGVRCVFTPDVFNATFGSGGLMVFSTVSFGSAPAPAPTLNMFSSADYTAAIQKLLPRGPAWPRDIDATQTKLMNALAAVFLRTDARAQALLVDAFPSTAVELLPEWEEALGVPGPFGTLAGTVSGQQAQVVRALVDAGGQSISYFVGLLASLGLTAAIVEFTRFTVRKPVGSPIYGDGWAHSWRVDIAGSQNSAIELLIRLFAPAHTVVAFTYH